MPFSALATNSTWTPSIPNIPSIQLPSGYDFWLAFVPAILVFIIGFLLRHQFIAIVVGVAAIVFGPAVFPSIFNYTIFSFETWFALTGLTLLIYMTFFCITSYFRELYGDIVEPLGIWGSLIVIVIILAVGYLIGRYYPELLDQILGSSLK